MTIVALVVLGLWSAAVLALAIGSWKMARAPHPPTLRTLPPGAALPAELDELAPVFHELGFEDAGAVLMDRSPEFTSTIALFRHDGYRAFVILEQLAPGAAPSFYLVSITERYGTLMSAARDAKPLDVLAAPDGVMLLIPDADLDELVAFHRRALHAIAPDAVSEVPRDLVEHVARRQFERSELIFRSGRMRLVDGEARTSGRFALLCAVLNLPPVSFLAKAIAKRRARAALREVPRGELGALRGPLARAEARVAIPVTTSAGSAYRSPS